MKAIRILVYGYENDCDLGSELIRIPDRDAVVEFVPAGATAPDADSIWRSDILVCRINSSAEQFAETVLRKVLDEYPYLPVIVIGGPANDRITPHTLGGVFYLPQTANAEVIGFEVTRALQSTWWAGISAFDLPFVVVDADGFIRRANDIALARFDDDIVGRSYCDAIEKRDDAFPLGHPVSEALSTGKAVSRYYRYSKSDGRSQWNHLLCRPIFGVAPSGGPKAAAVLLLEANRWAEIVEAPSVFHKCETVAQLCKSIVEFAKRLGFTRARLYRFDERDKSLTGCESVGLSPENEEWFRTAFTFSITGDESSQATFDAKPELPLLFIKPPQDSDEVAENSAVNSAVNYGLVRYCRPVEEKRLEMQDVGRWIEAQLFVPTQIERDGQTLCERRCWGKLSVDIGDQSDRLSVGDAADLALFAGAVSSAIARVEQIEAAGIRSKDQSAQLELFRDFATRLVEGLREPAGVRIDHTRSLLLKMYQRLTNADVVFFRRYEGSYPNDLLRLDTKQILWADGLADDQFQIPAQFQRGDGFSARLLNNVDSDGKWMGTPAPMTVGPSDAPPWETSQVKSGSRWNEKEVAFLREHMSAMHIPIVVAGKFRGAIVALNRGDRAFRVDRSAVQRFMDTAALWYDLGEFHDVEFWLADVLEEMLRVLPRFASVPDENNDEAFFVCLANALTSHVGLKWNRVWIFTRTHTGVATLVYAHGGTGGTEHSEVIRELETKFSRLGDLLDECSGQLKPLRANKSLDELYEHCVEKPRQDNRQIRIQYHSDAPTVPGNRLREILAHDYRTAPRFPIPETLHLKREWFHGPQAYPQPYLPTGNVYAFPLWCMHGNEAEPMGLILTEMLYDPHRQLETMKATTRLYLGLVASVLAFRHEQRRSRERFRGLSVTEHGLGIMEAWVDVVGKIQWLAAEIDKSAAAAEVLPTLIAQWNFHFADSNQGPASSSYVSEDSSLSSIAKVLLQPINDKMNRLFKSHQQSDCVTNDLAEFIDLFCGPLEDQRIHVAWKPGGRPNDPISVKCDPLILQDALSCLIENSRSAAKQIGRNAEIYLALRERNVKGRADLSLVEIEFTDGGPGIDEDLADVIFHQEFSHWNASASPVSSNTQAAPKGKGLGLVRSQLRPFRGDIRLIKHRGEVAELAAPPVEGRCGPVGATFVISFCIERVTSVAPRGANISSFAER